MSRLRALLSIAVYGTAAALLAGGSCKSVPTSAPQGAVITIFARPASVPLNGSARLDLALFEASGQPVPDDTVITLTTTLGSVAPGSVRTSGGYAQAEFTAGAQGGSATVTARSGSATPATVTIAVGGSAASVSVAASPASLPAGGGSTTVTATVRDAAGRPLEGGMIVFTSDQGSLASGGRPLTTSAQGLVSDVLTTTRDTTVTATIQGTQVSGTALVDVAGTGASQLTVTASPASLGAGGGTTTITATALGPSGLPVAQVPVVFSASAGSISPLVVRTDSNGQARATLSTSATSTTVTAEAPGGLSATVTVSAGASTPASFTLELSVNPPHVQPETGATPTPTPVAGCDDWTVTLSVLALSGTTPVPGVPVTFFTDRAADDARVRGRFCSSTQATTDANGQAVAYYTFTNSDLAFCRDIAVPCAGRICLGGLVSPTPCAAPTPVPTAPVPSSLNTCCCGVVFHAQSGSRDRTYVYRVYTRAECRPAPGGSKECPCNF